MRDRHKKVNSNAWEGEDGGGDRIYRLAEKLEIVEWGSAHDCC